MKQFVCTLFAFMIPVALSVGIDSICYLGTADPMHTSVGTYETRYMEPLDLILMKSVRSVSGSTPSSCAAVCSNLRVATPASCNIYYVVSGLCKAGVLDNPLAYAKQPGSSPSLLQVKVLQSVNSGALGSPVKPVSSSYSTTSAKQLNTLWDGIVKYGIIVASSPDPSPLEYFQVRVGNEKLLSQSRSKNHLCPQQDGPLKSESPIWLIMKCKTPLSGRYVTVQHYNGSFQIGLTELAFYAF